MSCKKCGGEMVPGKALGQTLVGGEPDLGGDVMTFSAGGPGVVIDCMKCTDCGWSVTGRPTAGGKRIIKIKLSRRYNDATTSDIYTIGAPSAD